MRYSPFGLMRYNSFGVDDMHDFVVIRYNSFGIDDIHALGVIWHDGLEISPILCYYGVGYI